MSDTKKLANLSSDIKTLVRDGVYSLYEVIGNENAEFLLITNDRKYFLLSSTGDVVQKLETIAGINLRKTTLFQSSSDSNPTLKLNYA